jgi:predicted negative regulator of RcsB-dependent stress response
MSEDEKEKSVFDHITDWFRELKELGIAGLLVGLGFVLVFIFYGCREQRLNDAKSKLKDF